MIICNQKARHINKIIKMEIATITTNRKVKFSNLIMIKTLIENPKKITKSCKEKLKSYKIVIKS